MFLSSFLTLFCIFFALFWTFFHRLDIQKVMINQTMMEKKELVVVAVSFSFACIVVLKFALDMISAFSRVYLHSITSHRSRGWILILISSCITIFITEKKELVVFAVSFSFACIAVAVLKFSLDRILAFSRVYLHSMTSHRSSRGWILILISSCIITIFIMLVSR